MRGSSVRLRLGITAALLVVLAFVVVIAVRAPADVPNSPGQMMTLDPRIIANLTQFPQATPLAGQDANDIVALQQMVDACAEYNAARRTQMDEQISFVMNPAGLPRDVIIALGANPRAKLLEALASITVVQWKLDQQPAGSCLIPIGKRLNQLINAAGGTPVAAFEGG